MDPAVPRPRRTDRNRQAGLTLVELMVGMAIGLALVAGLSLLFANTSQSAAEMDKSVRQIENGRFAVDLLTEDLSMAGFYAESPVRTTSATLSPCANSVDFAAELAAMRAASPATLPFAVQGLTPAQAAALPCLPNHRAGTPALVLRRVDTSTVTTASLTASQLYYQTSFHPGDTEPYAAGTSAADLSLRARDGTVNPVRRWITRIYYVATCNECGLDTVPTLKRAELRGASLAVAPLAEGVENIAFDYGFDTTNDGNVDQWWGLNGTASAPEQLAAEALGWGNVVAVRATLLTRTTEPSIGFVDSRVYASGLRGSDTHTVGPMGDAFKRRAYVTTARLHSVAGPRETP